MLKIAIIGPESTGKSEMSAYLAEHFNCLWVPEYAREYCANLDRDCTIEDELNMFHGQIALEKKKSEEALHQNHPFLFCDTTIITVKVWCEHVFGYCPAEVEQEYQTRNYDFYLLMKDDLPWQDDPLRNFPDKRDYFMNWYAKLMEEKSTNYAIIEGIGDIRFQNAVDIIKNIA